MYFKIVQGFKYLDHVMFFKIVEGFKYLDHVMFQNSTAL